MDSQVNRRRSRRCPPSSTLRVECRKGSSGFGSDLTLAILDISETGVRMVVRQPLEQGQEVELLLAGAGVQKPIRRAGCVVWSRTHAENQTCIGVALDKPLPFATVQRFMR
jgi:hypothetical protein